jgi:hypothetical protein
MFRLWYLAELDLLSEGQPYELRNTGQVRVKDVPYPDDHIMSSHLIASNLITDLSLHCSQSMTYTF